VDAALDPDRETDLALAREYARAGQHLPACERFARADRAGSLAPRKQVAWAASLLARGETSEALSRFDLALEKAPAAERDAVLHELARLRAPGREAELVRYWRRTRSREDASPVCTLALARAELAAGSEAEGTAHMLAYVRGSRDAAAAAELARLALRGDDAHLAASLAQRAAGIEPGRAGHHLLTGRALRRLGEAAAAEAAFRRALAASPRDARAARRLAGVLSKSGRADEAVAVWRRFAAAGGDPAAAHEGAAEAYLAIGDRQAALRELERAARLRPGDRRLRDRLDTLRE
jgi:tetratricopeptide (TPR) repeat protein